MLSAAKEESSLPLAPGHTPSQAETQSQGVEPFQDALHRGLDVVKLNRATGLRAGLRRNRVGPTSSALLLEQHREVLQLGPARGQGGDPKDPLSWNRYAYVNGDPVNHRDRRGLYDADWCDPDDPDDCEDPGYDCDDMFGFAEVDSCSEGSGPGDDETATSTPDCQDSFSQSQLGFVEANYSQAAVISATTSAAYIMAIPTD